MPSDRRAVIAALGKACVLVGLASCTGILGIDKPYRAEDDSSDGGAGGMTTSSGGAGGMSSGGAGGQGGSVACPAGAPGPDMVSLGTFCIDVTEVTNAHYAAFVAANPANQINGCDNNDITPAGNWPASPGDAQLPVVFVDWCDAASFCAWAGKSLCRGPEGENTGFNQYDNINRSGWHYACTQAGTSDHPYGAYESARCVDNAFDGVSGLNTMTDVAQPVGSAAQCSGEASPFDQVFDLSGNVREWEDACQTSGNNCRLRGGSFKGADSVVACAADDRLDPASSADDVGFRCCSSG